MRGNEHTLELHAVFAGDVLPVDDVPDPVFAEKMLGDGFAMVPPEDQAYFTVLSPLKGSVTRVFRTLHAVTFATEYGVEVLVHIGLDTVSLGGLGFAALVAKGDFVEPGTPIIAVDAAAVRSAGKNLITPVVLVRDKDVVAFNVTKGVAQAGARIAIAQFGAPATVRDHARN